MKKRPDLKFQGLLGTAKSQFDFLFQRGYRIVSALFTDPANQNWSIVFAGENNLIQVHCRDQKVSLTLSSEKLFDQFGMFDLYELIDLLQGEERTPAELPRKKPNETEQVIQAARILKQHLEEILTFFQKVHSNISFSIAGELSMDNSPVSFYSGFGKVTYATPA
jgi:hypothetical protein